MRVKLLLIGVLALVVGACSRTNSGTNAPPPLDKKLLTGKWKNNSDSQFISGYEFAEDGTLKVTLVGMGPSLVGRHSWSGERTLDLEYQLTPDVQQAYEAAAKAYKDDVEERIKTGKLDSHAGPSILGTVRDKWPATETIKVSFNEKPRQFMVEGEGGFKQTFDKAD
jgi:hypothetical protein